MRFTVRLAKTIVFIDFEATLGTNIKKNIHCFFFQIFFYF